MCQREHAPPDHAREGSVPARSEDAPLLTAGNSLACGSKPQSSHGAID